MKYDKGNVLVRLLAIVLIGLIILIGVLLYMINIAWILGVLFITENLLMASLIFILLKVQVVSRIERAQKEMTAAMEKFTLDSTETFLVHGTVEGFEEAYKGLEKLYVELSKREQMREEVLRLVNTAASNMELSTMLSELIPKLAEATNSEWGAFYQTNDVTNKLELKYSLGFSRNIYSEYDMSIGEGFIGKAVVTKRVQILKDIPDDTVYVTRTVLGKIRPKNLMTVPVIHQDHLVGIIVLASIYEYSNYNRQLMDFINYYLGLAIGNGITYERTKRLTNELQFQNKLIQNLNEELENKVKERTAFLNSVINSIQDYAIYSLDKNGYITTWNKCAERMMGYSSEEVLGEHINMIYSDDDIKTGIVSKRIEEVKRNGRYSEQAWKTRRDGSRRYIDMILFAMYDNKAEFIGLTNVSRDITQFKLFEDVAKLEKDKLK